MTAAEFAAIVERIRSAAPREGIALIDSLPDQYRLLGAVIKTRAALVQTADKGARGEVSLTRKPRAPRERKADAGPVHFNGEEVQPMVGTLDLALWCERHKLPADVVGRWVWVEFAEKPAGEIIAALKAAGFHWNRKRECWQHDCGFPSAPSRNSDPREKYGSVSVSEFAESEAQAAA